MSTNFYSDLTNRKLLKEYRSSVEHIAELSEKINKGWHLYLGESISARLRSCKKDLAQCKAELESRGYNIDKIKVGVAFASLRAEDVPAYHRPTFEKLAPLIGKKCTLIRGDHPCLYYNCILEKINLYAVTAECHLLSIQYRVKRKRVSWEVKLLPTDYIAIYEGYFQVNSVLSMGVINTSLGFKGVIGTITAEPKYITTGGQTNRPSSIN